MCNVHTLTCMCACVFVHLCDTCTFVPPNLLHTLYMDMNVQAHVHHVREYATFTVCTCAHTNRNSSFPFTMHVFLPCSTYMHNCTNQCWEVCVTGLWDGGYGIHRGFQHARCSVVNHHGNVLYDSYVAPMDKITNYRTKYSGITPQLLRDGKSVVYPLVIPTTSSAVPWCMWLGLPSSVLTVNPKFPPVHCIYTV